MTIAGDFSTCKFGKASVCKKIIIFYSDSLQFRFRNFPNGYDKENLNIYFHNIFNIEFNHLWNTGLFIERLTDLKKHFNIDIKETLLQTLHKKWILSNLKIKQFNPTKDRN